MASPFPIFVLLFCFAHTYAQNSPLCSTTACGGVSITYPFRLTTDPPSCGFNNPIFTLDCHRNQTPVLNAGIRKYNVLAISYSNFSIRVVDAALDRRNYSSCPIYSDIDNSVFDPDTMVLHPHASITYISFITCSGAMRNATSFVEDPFCGNRSRFSNSSQIRGYLGRFVSPVMLENSCVVDKEVVASSETLEFGDNFNFTYTAIHDMLSSGFELSWYRTECGDCEQSRGITGRCSLSNNNKVQCHKYCTEDIPLSERNLQCTWDYYAPVVLLGGPILIGGVLVARSILALPFVIVLLVLVYRRRKRLATPRLGQTTV